MTGKRKRYSADSKAKVALEALLGELTTGKWRRSVSGAAPTSGIRCGRRDPSSGWTRSPRTWSAR